MDVRLTVALLAAIALLTGCGGSSEGNGPPSDGFAVRPVPQGTYAGIWTEPAKEGKPEIGGTITLSFGAGDLITGTTTIGGKTYRVEGGPNPVYGSELAIRGTEYVHRGRFKVSTDGTRVIGPLSRFNGFIIPVEYDLIRDGLPIRRTN